MLLGTFAIFYLAGFSINTLTLFGLVLAIGLLVDDAIVVVENVERLMEENPGMTAREATVQSMKELQVALVAIGLVLSAVFLPMAFFGGSTGVIYRQFSITIVSAMVLSVFVALILSPALTSTLLKPRAHGETPPGRFPRFDAAMLRAKTWFNTRFDRSTERYVGSVERSSTTSGAFWVSTWSSWCCSPFCSCACPAAFCRARTRGGCRSSSDCPPGPQARTLEVRDAIEDHMLRRREGEYRNLVPQRRRRRRRGIRTEYRTRFINLTHWDNRPGKEKQRRRDCRTDAAGLCRAARRAGVCAGSGRGARAG